MMPCSEGPFDDGQSDDNPERAWLLTAVRDQECLASALAHSAYLAKRLLEKQEPAALPLSGQTAQSGAAVGAGRLRWPPGMERPVMFPPDALPISPTCQRLLDAMSGEYRKARDLAIAAGMMHESEPTVPGKVYALLEDMVERRLADQQTGRNGGFRRRTFAPQESGVAPPAAE